MNQFRWSRQRRRLGAVKTRGSRCRLATPVTLTPGSLPPRCQRLRDTNRPIPRASRTPCALMCLQRVPGPPAHQDVQEPVSHPCSIRMLAPGIRQAPTQFVPQTHGAFCEADETDPSRGQTEAAARSNREGVVSLRRELDLTSAGHQLRNRLAYGCPHSRFHRSPCNVANHFHFRPAARRSLP